MEHKRSNIVNPAISSLFTKADTALLDRRFNTVLNQDKQSSKYMLPLCLTAMTLLLALSFLFVVQPHIKPTDANQQLVSITPNNAYLVENSLGSYSVYIDGEFFAVIESNDISKFPFCDLEINLTDGL